MVGEFGNLSVEEMKARLAASEAEKAAQRVKTRDRVRKHRAQKREERGG
jgi:hypothetical protein